MSWQTNTECATEIMSQHCDMCGRGLDDPDQPVISADCGGTCRWCMGMTVQDPYELDVLVHARYPEAVLLQRLLPSGLRSGQEIDASWSGK